MLSLLILPQLASFPGVAPLLSPIFAEHMVLQRDRPNPIWGWTEPGKKVKVTVGNRHAEGMADATGKWMVKLAPPKVGGPYTMKVEGSTTIEFKDILVGDVWVLGGQSNMEMGISVAKDPDAEIAAAKYPNIRLCMVSKDTQIEPRLTTTAGWSVCSPETVKQGGWGGFSAVGYYFGRELFQKAKVPIGLIQDCWGGTPAEAWLSRGGIEKFGDFASQVAGLDASKANNHKAYGDQMDAWIAKADKGTQPTENWQAPEFDDSKWRDVNLPTTYEGMGFGGWHGTTWYRLKLDLPAGAEPITKEYVLNLGRIDDLDTTWVNGVKVGASYNYAARRLYRIPAGTFHAGINTIAVRAFDTGAAGGFIDNTPITLEAPGSPAITVSNHPAKMSMGASIWDRPAMPWLVENNPYYVTTLYNGMIAPVAPIAIKGALWYQGETNAGRAYQYRTLLPAMINDWRKTWGQGDFPFYIVQLANFMGKTEQPVESDWAELREAQAIAAKSVKNGGLVTAADIGDTTDIHPKNKQEVGRRLALLALSRVYRQAVVDSGPTFKSAIREGSKLRVTFDYGDGLTAGAGALKGFAIAGTDRKFHWATASIEYNTVVLSAPEVLEPIAVRYAWCNNPDITLLNGAGLPAFPFRSDDWPGVTKGRK